MVGLTWCNNLILLDETLYLLLGELIMIKTFCDHCGKEITDCVNIIDITTKWMASIAQNTTLELCNSCYRVLGWVPDSKGSVYHKNLLEILKNSCEKQ